MKYWKWLVIYFLPLILQGQEVSKATAKVITQQLFEVEILSEKGKQDLLSQIESVYVDSLSQSFFRTSPKDDTLKKEIRSTQFPYGKMTKERILNYLALLFDMEYRNRQRHPEMELAILKAGIATNPLDSSLFKIKYKSLDTNEIGLIHPLQSTMGMHLTKTLEDVKKIGLIDERVERELKKVIKKSRRVTEYILLKLAAQKVHYYQNYLRYKSEQLALLEKLQKNNRLSHENYQTLVESYQPYELKSSLDIIQLCEYALYVDLSNYPQEPTLLYTQLFKELKTFFPSLEFYNFEIEQNGDVLAVSFELEGRAYQKQFPHYVKHHTDKHGTSKSIPSISFDFHRLINKALADHQLPERIYYVYYKHKQLYNPWTLGYILLEKSERDLWTDGSLSQEVHGAFLTEFEIDNLIKDFETLGILAHLTPTQIEKSRQVLKGKNLKCYTDLLKCFEGVIADFNGSAIAETIYEDYTNAMAMVSKNQFSPANVIYYCEENEHDLQEKCYLEFEIGIKKYTFHFESSTWVDESLVSKINKLLKVHHIDGQFYVTDGVLSTIFLTAEQHDYLFQHYPALFGQWRF